MTLTAEEREQILDHIHKCKSRFFAEVRDLILDYEERLAVVQRALEDLRR